MILKFIDIKDPILRLKAKPVGQIDKKITELILDMKETLRAADDPEGIGLAAPQIGKSIQLFIISYDGTERVVINPKIVFVNKIKKTGKSKDKTLEGCLSLPHYYGPIKRSEKITINYTDENAESKQETFQGFLAHIVGHEIDHLNGVLFIDHILSQNAPLYLFDGEEFEEVELA